MYISVQQHERVALITAFLRIATSQKEQPTTSKPGPGKTQVNNDTGAILYRSIEGRAYQSVSQLPWNTSTSTGDSGY